MIRARIERSSTFATPFRRASRACHPTRGFGLQAKQVRSKAEYPKALAEMLASEGPYLLDVLCPYQEHVLPMIPGGKTVRDIITE